MAETISREELIWLACAIDSEGCITLSKDPHQNSQLFSHQCYVSISNIDPLFIWKIGTIYQGLGLKFHYSCHKSKANNWCLWIRVNGKGSVKKLLTAVREFLIVKLVQANVMIDFIEQWEKVKDKIRGNRWGRTPEQQQTITWYAGLQQITTEKLSALKENRLDLQRLSRIANRPLDLEQIRRLMIESDPVGDSGANRIWDTSNDGEARVIHVTSA